MILCLCRCSKSPLVLAELYWGDRLLYWWPCFPQKGIHFLRVDHLPIYLQGFVSLKRRQTCCFGNSTDLVSYNKDLKASKTRNYLTLFYRLLKECLDPHTKSVRWLTIAKKFIVSVLLKSLRTVHVLETKCRGSPPPPFLAGVAETSNLIWHDVWRWKLKKGKPVVWWGRSRILQAQNPLLWKF